MGFWWDWPVKTCLLCDCVQWVDALKPPDSQKNDRNSSNPLFDQLYKTLNHISISLVHFDQHPDTLTIGFIDWNKVRGRKTTLRSLEGDKNTWRSLFVFSSFWVFGSVWQSVPNENRSYTFCKSTSVQRSVCHLQMKPKFKKRKRLRHVFLSPSNDPSVFLSSHRNSVHKSHRKCIRVLVEMNKGNTNMVQSFV